MSKLKQAFTQFTDSSNNNNKKKKLFLSLFATLLLVASVVAIVAGVNSHKNNNSSTSSSLELSHHSHTIIKSACSSTFYQDLCFSAVASEPGVTKKVTSHKDVIELSLNVTCRTVEHNFFVIKKLLEEREKMLTHRERIALHDCLVTIDESLDELHQAYSDIKLYPNSNKKTLYQHADDLNTLISAAITNQVTCLDGFSHDAADKKVRKALEQGQVHVEHMCSNALAMTKNLTDTDIANYEQKMLTTATANGGSRKLMTTMEEGEDENGIKWPKWMSVGDRRLLQAATVKPDVVVAADGSGNFKTVSEAVKAAPEKSSKRYVIKIKAGVYRENVEVTKKKMNIMFLGDGRSNTIITGSRNVKDGDTTFNSATVGKFSSP
ncbi:Pectinesterase/pectinesterase inhibitor U1 [Stylosanthes scabra]|uniref:Pectinesterase/pectinesterase inhibitor U1 n=1 Tax=Stylosanthes scabra TaxID=79078 RepID=A0ABU6YSN6_9FABA|nr:Pectinesterase/pectinesterase inhibitor U1 [Stylosanthes scabra]